MEAAEELLDLVLLGSLGNVKGDCLLLLTCKMAYAKLGEVGGC